MKTKLLIALFGLLLCLGGAFAWCIAMHLSHHIRRGFLLAMRKKYVVKNLQSLMLPDIVSIFLLNCRYIKRKGIN